MKTIQLNKTQLMKLGLTSEQADTILEDGIKTNWMDNIGKKGQNIYSIDISYELKPIKDEPKPHYFRTIVDVDNAIEKCKLYASMLNFATIKNEGWTPCFEQTTKKYGIIQEKSKLKVGNNIHFNPFVFGIALKTQEVAEEMFVFFQKELEIHFLNQINYVADELSSENDKEINEDDKFYQKFDRKKFGMTKKEFILKNLDKMTIDEFAKIGVTSADVYNHRWLQRKLNKKDVNEIEVNDAYVFEPMEQSKKQSILTRFLKL